MQDLNKIGYLFFTACWITFVSYLYYLITLIMITEADVEKMDFGVNVRFDFKLFESAICFVKNHSINIFSDKKQVH